MQELTSTKPVEQDPLLPPSEPQLGRDKLSREDEAQRDLTSTSVSRSVALFICISFLASILLVVALDWLPIGRVRGGNIPRLHVAGYTPNATELHQFETDIEHHSHFANWILPPTQQFLSKTLGQGDEKAYIGTDGWLYYSPDIDYVIGPGFLKSDVLRKRTSDGIAANPLPALIELNRQLAARGISLIVMPVPVKPMIDPEGLGVSSRTLLQNASYATFRRQLAAQGIAVCDVADLLAERRRSTNEAQFLKTDTHWTPNAMQAAATELATFIKQRSLVATGGLTYKSTTQSITGSGDISAMLRLPNPRALGVDTVHERQILRSGGTWRPDRKAQVLLLGDSFSNIYSDPSLGWGAASGLAEQLSFDLGQPVDKIALNAGGAFQTRKALFDQIQRGDDRLAGKRVVVYEFAMRDLAQGDWKPLDFAPRPAAPSIVQSGPRMVQCRILDVAQAPDPRQTVYPDCLIEMRLRPSANQSSDLLAYTWGLRNGKYAMGAGLHSGQIVTLTISPWATVEQQVGNISRIDLDNADPSAPVFWADPTAQPTPVPPATLPAAQPHGTPLPDRSPDEATTLSNAITRRFVADVRKKIAQAAANRRLAIRGKNNWIFFVPDARNATAGVFWGRNGWKASQAVDPAYSAPLPPILDFDRQLKARGIELLLVLVPDKTLVYPDLISSTIATSQGHAPPKVDDTLRRFRSILRKSGVNVLDLTDRYLSDPRRLQLYYAQDTHWTPYGASIAAALIAQFVEKQSWYPAVPKHTYVTSDTPCGKSGDLVGMLGANDLTIEQEECSKVEERVESGFWLWKHASLVPFTNWTGSPVVLLGDSYADRLNQPLATSLGFAPDIQTVDGSGGEQARIRLARFGNNLRGKKVVVWCFSSRELTEERGWRNIQVIK